MKKMRNDIPYLKAWFKKYDELTNMELAQLADVNVETINDWKRKCGIKLNNRGWGSNLSSRPEAFKKAPKPKKVEVEQVPKSVWKNKKWLTENYKKYGLVVLSRMTNYPAGNLHTRMLRWGIKMRSPEEATRSKNPYCNREWLEEYYEVLGHTLSECAEVANVNMYTIMNWLVKFKIPIRDTYECQYGELSKNYGKKIPKVNDTGPDDSTNASSNDSTPDKASSTNR